MPRPAKMAKMADSSAGNNSTSVFITSLNDLPEHILLHIISFLSTNRNTTQTTSLISRKWRKLWLSNPTLKFHKLSSGSGDLEYLRRFAAFVTRTLIRRSPNAPLLTFDLIVNFNNGVSASQVTSWIRYAVSRGVENLRIVLDTFIVSLLSFEFPFHVLRDSQVRILKLSSCSLSVPSSSSEKNAPPRFSSLLSVRLDGVDMTDQILVDLVTGCVNLEVLVLSRVQGCQDIKIYSSKLRELKLQFFTCEEGSVEIVAPNLCILTISGFYIGDYAIMDASSIAVASVDMNEFRCWAKIMRLLGHVKHLSTVNWWFEFMESKDVYSECFILLNLKHVQLETCYTKADLMGISMLLDFSPNLETMVLEYCPLLIEWMPEGQMSEEIISEDFFKQLVFNVQSLRYVKMKSFMGTECEKNLVIFLLKTAVLLESIMLIPAEFVEVTPQHPIVLDPQFKQPSGVGIRC